MTLYHYTCDHGLEGIERLGYVAPNWHPIVHARLAWFTDMDTPDAARLGLTSMILDCDRTQHRIEVNPNPLLVPWIGSPWHASMPFRSVLGLHAGGVDPERWFVSAIRVSAS